MTAKTTVAAVTVRRATKEDSRTLVRLAQLDQAATPADPVLIGELFTRPVAALSLGDGNVVADPFTPTAEVVALLRLRARQLGYRARIGWRPAWLQTR